MPYSIEFDCPTCGSHQHVGEIELVCGSCGTRSNDVSIGDTPHRKVKSTLSRRQKLTLARQIDRTATHHEDPFRKAATKAFREQRREIAAIMDDVKSRAVTEKATVDLSAVMTVINEYLLREAGEDWRSTFIPALTGVIEDQQESTAVALGLKFDVRNLEGEAWFQNYVLKFANEAIGTTQKDIQEVIANGLAEGWGADKTAKQIDLLFEQYLTGGVEPDKWLSDRLPTYRKEMIARTETIRASNQGQIAQYKEWGVVQKEWFASPDACEFCLDMHGKIIGVSEPYFRQGDSMELVDEDDNPIVLSLDYEDVDGPPLHPNCRCVVLPVIVDMGEVGPDKLRPKIVLVKQYRA